jgi:sugar/nucleoside kinase (ribokinase family)
MEALQGNWLIDNAAKYQILGIGTPCMDILVKMSTSVLKEMSLQKGDSLVVNNKDRFQEILEKGKQNIQDLTKVLGGSCLNTVKTLSKLGIPTAFLSQVGNDDSWNSFKKLLNQLSIYSISSLTDLPISQVAACITEEGERAFAVYPNVSMNISRDLLTKKLFENVKVLHFEGYVLREYAFSFIKEAVLQAKAAGTMISYDLGCEDIVSNEKFRNAFLELLPQVDVLFANEQEMNALRWLLPLESQISSEKIGSHLVDNYCHTVVLLKGKEGVEIFSKDVGHFIVPTEEVSVVDSDGAGDFFTGGFLAALVEGLPLKECAEIGNVLGGLVVQHEGANLSEGAWDLALKTFEQYVKHIRCQKAS